MTHLNNCWVVKLDGRCWNAAAKALVPLPEVDSCCWHLEIVMARIPVNPTQTNEHGQMRLGYFFIARQQMSATTKSRQSFSRMLISRKLHFPFKTFSNKKNFFFLDIHLQVFHSHQREDLLVCYPVVFLHGLLGLVVKKQVNGGQHLTHPAPHAKNIHLQDRI